MLTLKTDSFGKTSNFNILTRILSDFVDLKTEKVDKKSKFQP